MQFRGFQAPAAGVISPTARWGITDQVKQIRLGGLLILKRTLSQYFPLDTPLRGWDTFGPVPGLQVYPACI